MQPYSSSRKKDSIGQHFDAYLEPLFHRLSPYIDVKQCTTNNLRESLTALGYANVDSIVNTTQINMNYNFHWDVQEGYGSDFVYVLQKCKNNCFRLFHLEVMNPRVYVPSIARYLVRDAPGLLPIDLAEQLRTWGRDTTFTDARKELLQHFVKNKVEHELLALLRTVEYFNGFLFTIMFLKVVNMDPYLF